VPGVLLASTDGAGWTVETADLWLTGRHRGSKRVSTDPLGDVPQLIVCRYGRLIAYCAGEADLARLGVDLRRMAVTARW
jgi:hypothetical protein